jgi:phosphoribosyl-ATP pyrophosphohydrolase
VLADPSTFAMAEPDILARLEAVIAARKSATRARPTSPSLNAKGLDAILKKIGRGGDRDGDRGEGGERDAIVHETADLWFHCLVMLAWHGMPWRTCSPSSSAARDAPVSTRRLARS